MNPLDAFRLDEKVVVITGASSGLGAGFARAVASLGASVVLAARRADKLEALADELRGAGTPTLALATDVAEPSDCARVVASAVETFGRIDSLVNNAGVSTVVPSSRETVDGFRRVIDVNLNGTFWMAQECARVMPPGSSIVNVASILGSVAPHFPQAAYSASKAGVLGLTRSLAQEWSRRKGIRVNALCPGFFLTEMTADSADQLQHTVDVHTMMGRFGEQTDLDPALIFLVSDASRFMTGASITVDGGWTAL